MKYDVAIIGGGIAGLALSIDLKKKGFNIIAIEKGNYPRHKVCGEYISMESHHYLETICPQISSQTLPKINKFRLTSSGKSEFNTTLDLGGFGISRYLLELLLYQEAVKQGVKFMTGVKAQDITADPDGLGYVIKTSKGEVTAFLVCNSTGRRSNIKTKGKENETIAPNYVGVKYHIKLERDPELIEIHNFEGGYCGVSNVEENKSCLCYIVNSKKLNSVQNSIPELEKKFLYRNVNLRNLFTKAEFLFKEPVTVSGINFSIRQPVSDHSFYLGDSAGSIAPITGNGMSMGLRSAFALASFIDRYFSKEITKEELIRNYTSFWNKEFSMRIKSSRYIQKLSEYSFLSKRTIELFNLFPSLAKGVIRHTHGKPF